jgi:predicted DNA-binding transcriptional regulator YafY
MPIDKNKLHRYRILNELLSDRSRYYTIKDLEKLCSQRLVEDGFDGVSVRTIRYDLHDIETEYGIDISHIKINGKTCFRYSDEGFSIPGFEKEKKDVVDLRRKLAKLEDLVRGLDGFEGIPMFDWVYEMQLRIKEAIGSGDKSTIVSFETGNIDVSKLKFLNIIYNAIIEYKVLEVRGYSFRLNEDYRKIVSPYLLKQYNCRWYLIGKVHGSDVELECLPLDRITHVSEINKRYISYENGNVNDYYDDVIGVTVFADAEVETIKLRVDNKTLPYILSRPLHGSQYQDKNNPNIIVLDLIVNYELKSKLRSYGAAIEVIEPQSLRDEMKKEYLQALAIYNNEASIP